MHRRAILLGPLALAACGFTPVYGPDNLAGDLQNATAFVTPDSISGYRLLQRLEDRLGTPQTALYTLTVTLDLTEDNVAISEDGQITRITLPGTATYTLTGPRETSGTVQSFTSYSTTGTTVATQTAADDARDRLAIILADQIVTRLIALP